MSNNIQIGCHETISWQSIGDSLLLEIDIQRTEENNIPVVERVSIQLDWNNTKLIALGLMNLVKENEAQPQHDGPS